MLKVFKRTIIKKKKRLNYILIRFYDEFLFKFTSTLIYLIYF